MTDVCVLVPTRNEAGNIGALVARLDAALGSASAEIVFVDDSDDDTPEQVLLAAARCDRPVRLLHRPRATRTGGLGGAVVHGFRHTTSSWVVVMDGDLQHPPEVVPRLLERAAAEGADLVVASRYAGDGDASGLSDVARRVVSSGATWLTRSVFPRRLAKCTDPMSGFFAVRRDALPVDALRPDGFKILLEIIGRAPALRITECPFTFETRVNGESKASLAEGLVFLRLLLRLRLASSRARMLRVGAFGLVGATGLLVNSLALMLFTGGAKLPVLVGATLATQVSTLWNFVLTDQLVFRGDKRTSYARRLLGFAVVNNVALLARLPVLSVLVGWFGVGYVTANVETLLAVFAARFFISDRYLFRSGVPLTVKADTAAAGSSRAAEAQHGPVDPVVDVRASSRPTNLRSISLSRSPERYLPYRYDIHGLVSLGSTVRLRELDYFQVPRAQGPFDIEIRAMSHGSRKLRRRARVTQYASPAAVSYEEHLGRFGSDFRIDMSNGIEVEVGPMLVRSPHVLYTNVVEALLRFVLVSRDYMLLHSACLEIDGRGVVLSALTDTGKTGTVLRLVRENATRFLSDDMTIVGPDGWAMSYPKPLTISQHTLRAVNAGDLTRREWRRLRVQSRLHSREGRGVGTRLGEMNVPIMSMNALTQYVVPPPKYVIDRLVPAEHTERVRLQDLFIIERGEHRLAPVPRDAALLDELIANTDDAYGFPPFRYFAPALVVGGMTYEELRARERGILASALAAVSAFRLATPDFTWADRIAEIVVRGEEVPAPRADHDGGRASTEVLRG